MVKLLVPTKSEVSNSEVQIQWSTRLRSEPRSKQAKAASLQDTYLQISQSSFVSGEEQSTLGDKIRECENGDSEDADNGDDGGACAVCLVRAPDCELQPCGHTCCCRSCAVETVCTWRQDGPPRCVLCRAPFHAMVFA